MGLRRTFSQPSLALLLDQGPVSRARVGSELAGPTHQLNILMSELTNLLHIACVLLVPLDHSSCLELIGTLARKILVVDHIKLSLNFN